MNISTFTAQLLLSERISKSRDAYIKPSHFVVELYVYCLHVGLLVLWALTDLESYAL